MARPIAAAVLALLAVLPGKPAAAAGTGAATCIAAGEAAFIARKAGHLRQARAELVKCAVPACPTEVRLECEKQLEGVKAALPTIVFAARDGQGHDLAAVTVTMDGAPLVDRLDGAALDLDAGEHRFTFRAEGHPLLERTYVLRQGEKGRHEEVVLGPATPPPPLEPPPQPVHEATAPAPPPAEPSPSFWNGPRVAAVAVEGVAVAGLAVGSIFGLQAMSRSSSQKNECPSTPGCSPAAHDRAQSDHSGASTDATVSTVAFIGGGVALAAGAVLWLTAPGAASREGTSSVAVSPVAGPTGGGLRVVGWF